MKVSIIFLTRNEEDVLGPTLRDAVAWTRSHSDLASFEILVVDNASTDGTADIVRAFSKDHPEVRLIVHDVNRGYALSNITAFQEADGDVLFVCDGDGQLTLRDVPAFLNKIQEGFPVVYGWRKERHDPTGRIVISFFLNLLSRLILRWPFHDINCGYRAVTRDVAKSITTARPINFFGPELWALTRRNGWAVTEVPVEHFERAGGTSIHAFWRMPISMWNGLSYLLELRKDLAKGVDRHAKRRLEKV